MKYRSAARQIGVERRKVWRAAERANAHVVPRIRRRDVPRYNVVLHDYAGWSVGRAIAGRVHKLDPEAAVIGDGFVGHQVRPSPFRAEDANARVADQVPDPKSGER